jgi:methionine--tRNA ligase beta chain
MISIDDFKKVELRTAKVLSASPVDGSDKLLRLTISLGAEERQIVSGIGKQYPPDSLVGKSIVVVANLEPRTLMGLESQGMIVAASDGNMISILTPDKEVEPGSIIR